MSTCAPGGDVSMTSRARFRHIIQEPKDGGEPCPSNLLDVSPCPLCRPKTPGPTFSIKAYELPKCIEICPGKRFDE